MIQVFETDWLASSSVFYNEHTAKVSRNINEVIDFDNIEFDPEGLYNYLDFGYSVLGQTPIRHVKFLEHSSTLTRHADGRLQISKNPDIAEAWVGVVSREEDVLARLRTRVQEWENSVAGNIIIPTSGGYDSRLLHLMISDRSRVHAFTYGLSDRQAESFEVVKARRLAMHLGVRWRQIELGSFHRYLGEWDAHFGVSTHAHGMYQMEFYNAIRKCMGAGTPLLSGIIGDAWAGSVEIPPLSGPDDLTMLGYTHGLRADPRTSLLRTELPLRREYFERMSPTLADPMMRVVEAMRFKLILLSYLLTVPRAMGFLPWGPFLQSDIALSMLTLPEGRRRGRAWQRDYFSEAGVDFESGEQSYNSSNTLNLQAMRKWPLPPLDVGLLREVIQPRYIDWINRSIGRQGPMWEWLWFQSHWRPRKVGFLCDLLALNDERLPAYSAYITLKPIECLLKRRKMKVLA
jgi:hypothetical protein